MAQDSTDDTSKSKGVLERIEREHFAWHREQWPDLPPHIAWSKMEAELAELKVAIEGWQWRHTCSAEDAVYKEASDVLITLLGVLRFMPQAGGTAFSEALAKVWEDVSCREYDGAASATRVRP